MPLDTSIYNQLLRPPKTVAEYDSEAVANQTNALALQQGRAKMDEYQRSVADGNKLRQVVAGFGADQTQNYNALLGAGRLDEAQKYQKANADTGKVLSDTKESYAKTDKLNLESVGIASQQHRDMLNTVSDPQTAAKWVAAAYADPRLAPIAAHGGTLEEAIARIPTDPKAFQDWKTQASLSSDKLIEYTRPTANTVATNNTSLATNAATNATSRANARYSADSSARTAGARLAFDKEQAKATDDGVMDPLSVRMTAQQYLAGDSGALANFGRGAQGAENLKAVRAEIAKQATQAGMSGADIAAKMAEFGGLKAGQRTAGTRSANIEIAANEVAQLAPIALEASAKVSRSGFLPFGKAQIMFDSNTNNPDMRQFAMANTALVNAYGQAMARGGSATVSDKDHARELLSTAFDQPSYAAAVAQLQKETRAAQAAPKQVRKDLSDGVSGRDSPSASSSSAIPSGWSVKEH